MQIKCIQMRPELPEDKKFFCHAQRPLRGPGSKGSKGSEGGGGGFAFGHACGVKVQRGKVLKIDRPDSRRFLRFDGAFGPEGCGLP